MIEISKERVKLFNIKSVRIVSFEEETETNTLGKTVLYENIYDINGNLVIEYFSLNKSIYQYDEKENVLIHEYYVGNKLKYRNKHKNYYNDRNDLIKIERIDENQETLDITHKRYDNNHLIIENKVLTTRQQYKKTLDKLFPYRTEVEKAEVLEDLGYNEGWDPREEKRTFYYDENGNLKEESLWINNRMLGKNTYFFDQYGKLLEDVLYDYYQFSESRQSYEYERFGHVVSKIIEANGKIEKIKYVYNQNGLLKESHYLHDGEEKPDIYEYLYKFHV